MCLEDTVRIPLRARDGSIRAYALIDAADADFVNQWRWHLSTFGYVVRDESNESGRHSIRLHREILGLTRDDDREVDHINRNRLDCRRTNLRAGTHAANGQNVPSQTGSSQFRGVTWDKAKSRWRAQMTINGRNITLGVFRDEHKAAEAARQARSKHMPFATD